MDSSGASGARAGAGEGGPRLAFTSLSTSVGMYDTQRAIHVLVGVLAETLQEHKEPIQLVLVEHDASLRDAFAKVWPMRRVGRRVSWCLPRLLMRCCAGMGGPGPARGCIARAVGRGARFRTVQVCNGRGEL
jgi:hypothetical protein